jgi:aerobic carbon-monoxide dehydrogenase large subunit
MSDEPRAADATRLRWVEDDPLLRGRNPLGVNGVGEAGTTGALAAVMNALADAVPGAAHMDMPATPEKAWAACRGDMTSR